MMVWITALATTGFMVVAVLAAIESYRAYRATKELLR